MRAHNIYIAIDQWMFEEKSWVRGKTSLADTYFSSNGGAEELNGSGGGGRTLRGKCSCWLYRSRIDRSFFNLIFFLPQSKDSATNKPGTCGYQYTGPLVESHPDKVRAVIVILLAWTSILTMWSRTLTMTRTVILLLLASTPCLTTEAARSSTRSQRPNIVFVLADDLGWNEVPWHNPNLR